jgi:hypothetical protein
MKKSPGRKRLREARRNPKSKVEIRREQQDKLRVERKAKKQAKAS